MEQLQNQRDVLRSEIIREEIIESALEKRESNCVPISNAFTDDVINEMKIQLSHLEMFLSFIEKEYIPIQEKLKKFLDHDEISFDLLWCVFHIGVLVIFKDPESLLLTAGKVVTLAFVTNFRSLALVMLASSIDQHSMSTKHLRSSLSTLIITGRFSIIRQ